MAGEVNLRMIEDGAAEGVIRDWDPQRSLSGYTVGVLCIDSHYPIIPGNAQDARTFPFPVLQDRKSVV